MRRRRVRSLVQLVSAAPEAHGMSAFYAEDLGLYFYLSLSCFVLLLAPCFSSPLFSFLVFGSLHRGCLFSICLGLTCACWHAESSRPPGPLPLSASLLLVHMHALPRPPVGQAPTQASETLPAGPLRVSRLPSWRAASSSPADAPQPPARSHRLRVQPWWLGRVAAPRRRQPSQRLSEPCEDDG